MTSSAEEHVVRFWQRGPALAPGPPWRPGVSVVVCTHRRPQSVSRLLESLAAQTRPPDELLVVDASGDAATEGVVKAHRQRRSIRYWRVGGPLRGLTRQRNFALSRLCFDLVAFFDDDVVLEAHCLERLEAAHRNSDHVGIGCVSEVFTRPTPLWRLRRALGIVPDLRPGSYTRGGMSVPWRFQAPTDRLVDGDWLPGCAMMLETAAASAVRFDEALRGYAQGEDLEFSLRLLRRGRLGVLGTAQCQHLHEPAGRPDPFRLGEMEIWNRHRIWRRVHHPPTLRARCSFAYTWSLDTLLLARDAIRPGRSRDGIRRIAGRLAGAARVLIGGVQPQV